MGGKIMIWTARAALLAVVGAGCVESRGGDQDWVLPATAEVASWFGEDTEAAFDGNVLEIRGEIDPEYLRRGGRIWARSAPYFYLFNVHVQQLLLDYPDIAAVRAIVVAESVDEVARATLRRTDLNEIRWREALARASQAQRDGTERPRLVERLIRFGEDHTEYRYGDVAN